MDIRVGQRVRSTLTDREYEVRKILHDNSVILYSEKENASALINKDQMKGLFDLLDSKSRDASDSE